MRIERRSVTGRAAAAGLVAVLLGAGAGACSGDGGGDAGSGGAAPTTVAEAAGRSRHVLLIGMDGLGDAAVADPAADFHRDLAAAGAGLRVVPPAADAATGCGAAWAEALRDGGDPAAPGVVDAAVEDGVDVGVFTTSATVAPVISPTGEPATPSGVAAPGLEPWPRALLGTEAARDAAIEHVAGARGPSLTILHTDVLAQVAGGPPPAGDPEDLVDDVADLAVNAVTARTTRSGEEWITVVFGGCSADGSPVVLSVEGDGVTAGATGDAAPSAVGALVAAHLGLDGAGGDVPDAVLEGS